MLSERMQDDYSTSRLSHIDGPSQAAMALHSHLPKLAAEMFDVRLANPFDAKFLDQANDMVQLCPDVAWKGVKFRQNCRIQDLDAPTQRSIIPILVSAGLHSIVNLFVWTRPHSDFCDPDPSPAGLGGHQPSRGANRPSAGPDLPFGGVSARAEAVRCRSEHLVRCDPGCCGHCALDRVLGRCLAAIL